MMKKITIILILLNFNVWLSFSQSNSKFLFSPKFFSLNNAQLHGGISAEGFILNEKPKPDDNTGLFHNFYKRPENIAMFDSIKQLGFTFSLDLYAPNSRLGFCLDLNYSYNEFSLKDKNNSRIADRFKAHTLTTPLYLKFRTGKIEALARTVIMAGYFFSFPIAVNRYNYGSKLDDKDKNQIQFNQGLSFIVGEEFNFTQIFTKNYAKACTEGARGLLYAKLNLRMKSLLNTNYIATDKSILNGQFSDSDFRDYQLTVGVRILGRFTRCKR
jgi:hypothetical protein